MAVLGRCLCQRWGLPCVFCYRPLSVSSRFMSRMRGFVTARTSMKPAMWRRIGARFSEASPFAESAGGRRWRTCASQVLAVQRWQHSQLVRLYYQHGCIATLDELAERIARDFPWRKSITVVQGAGPSLQRLHFRSAIPSPRCRCCSADLIPRLS